MQSISKWIKPNPSYTVKSWIAMCNMWNVQVEDYCVMVFYSMFFLALRTITFCFSDISLLVNVVMQHSWKKQSNHEALADTDASTLTSVLGGLEGGRIAPSVNAKNQHTSVSSLLTPAWERKYCSPHKQQTHLSANPTKLHQMRAELSAAYRSHLATGQKSSVNGDGKKQWPAVICLLVSEPLCHLMPRTAFRILQQMFERIVLIFPVAAVGKCPFISSFAEHY